MIGRFFTGCLAAVAIVAGVIVSGAEARADARVVVSVPPLHSLVAQLLDGVDEPTLLMQGETPSFVDLSAVQVGSLRDASLVVWSGAELEPALAQARLLVKGLDLKTMRLTATVPVLARSEEDNPDRTAKGHDLRFWLDPRLAKVAVRRLAPRLALLYPDHAERVLDNETHVVHGLMALEKGIRRDLDTPEGVPLHVGGSDLRYLEWRFNVGRMGCARLGFDPMGYDLEPGSGLYRKLMEGATAAMAACRVDQVAENTGR